VNNNGANGGTGLRFNNPSFNVSTANTTAGSRTLTLGGTNTDANTIAGTITNNSGAGAFVNLTKAGNGRWILSGTNKYSGSTSVTGGILSMANPSLADGADVSIATGATLDLNFSGTDTIGKLILQGVEQAQGNWGSLTSNARYKTASITGTGVLNVTVGNILKATPTVTIPPVASTLNSGQTLASSTLSGGVASVSGTFSWTDPTVQPAAGTSSCSVTFTPADTFYYTNATTTVSVTVNAPGYPSWVGGYNWAVGDSSPTGDPDGDGLANLVEYATGQNPTVASANPITFRQVQINGNTYLQLSVTRNQSVTNVLMEGLSAGTLSDPAAWSSSTTVTMSNTPSLFMVRDSLSIEGNNKRFLCLRFTLLPQ
jgi:autotransporter-associated beta strand protein